MNIWESDKGKLKPFTRTSRTSAWMWIKLKPEAGGKKYLARFDFHTGFWVPLHLFYGPETCPFIVNPQVVHSWKLARPPVHPLDPNYIGREPGRNAERVHPEAMAS